MFYEPTLVALWEPFRYLAHVKASNSTRAAVLAVKFAFYIHANMDTIPVLNCFNGHMTVKHSSMMRLVSLGKCRIVFGPDGAERGLEWVFDGYNAAQPGLSRDVKSPANYAPIFDDFTDAEPGMPILQFWKQQSSRPGVVCSQ